jgi:hypothetical protein
VEEGKGTLACPSWMATLSLVLVKCRVTVAESGAIAREIHPGEQRKEKFIRMPRNGSGSKTVHHVKVGKARAKEKERKVETEIVRVNLCATIGAKGTATAAMLQRATSLMMVLKDEQKEKGKEQRYCSPKPLRKQRKKSLQW